MKKCAISSCLAVAVLLLVNHALAEVIFDTGTPLNDGAYGYLEAGKGFAIKFSLSQPYSLTSLEAHMSGKRWNYDDVRWPQASGTATAAIYGDYAGYGLIPDTGTQFFSQQFDIDAATGWYGVSGVAWTLPAGEYWVAFEVRDGDTYGGAMDYPAPNAVYSEALITNYGTYSNNDDLNFGMRAYGNAVAPEPVSMLLFGLGGAVMGISRKLRLRTF